MSEYRTTFNYWFSHRILPNIYYANLEYFYTTVITSPGIMQQFLEEAMQRAVEMADGNPEIQPPFTIDEFIVGVSGKTPETAVLIVAIPHCEKDCDCIQIAFPLLDTKAKYYTCELSTNPLDGEKLFIIGAWEQTEEGGLKHINYGEAEITDSQSFANLVIEMVYG